MNGPDPEPSAGDSREKWITIDKLCDAYEASLQDGKVERAPFLAGVPVDWRDQLSHELDAIDAAYQDACDTKHDLEGKQKSRRMPIPASVAELETPGTKQAWLGRFEVRERLGTGATGSVWRARDDRLDRWVALKVPHATRVMSDTTAARFKTEARAAAAISHPNVVQVHEVLIEDGLPILIQQWIDGPSLADYLKDNGPMDCDQAAEWMAQIADAVSCAHESGIVHRDLKPANVMINQDRPMVLDFGLASYPQFSSGLTTEGTMLGTPAYMSPEQADRKATGSEPESDIYALGTILYEMLVGSTPFVGKTNEVLDAIRNTMPTPPRNRRSGIPRDLETITMRCLAKSPSTRYRSAADLRDDLERFRARKPILARKVSAIEHALVWCRAHPVSTLSWITVPLVALLAIAFAVSRLEQNQLSDQTETLVEEQGRLQAQLDERGEQLEKQRSVLQLARASQELTSGDRKRGMRMLADIPGQHRDWEWHLLDTLSSSPSVTLGTDPNADTDSVLTSIVATPDGRTVIAATEHGDLMRWRLPETMGLSSQADVSVETLMSGQVRIDAVAISPNGRLLAWTDEVGSVGIWNLDKDQFVQRVDHASRQPGYAIAFAPNSKRLVVGGGRSGSSRHSLNRASWLAAYTVDRHGALNLVDERSDDDWNAVSALCFVSNERTIVTRGGRNERVEATGYVESWRFGREFERMPDAIWKGFNARGLDFHAPTNRIAWCDSLGMFYVYDLTFNQTVCRKRGSKQGLMQVQFSESGDSLFVAGEEPEIACWSLELPPEASDSESGPSEVAVSEFSSKLRYTYLGHERTVRDLGLISLTPPKGESANGNRIMRSAVVSCSDDGFVRLWWGTLDKQIGRFSTGRRGLADARWLDRNAIAFSSYASGKSKAPMVFREHEWEQFGIRIEQRHVRFAGPIQSPSADGLYTLCTRERIYVLESGTERPVRALEPEAPELESFTCATLLDSRWLVAVSSCRATTKNKARFTDAKAYLMDLTGVVEPRIRSFEGVGRIHNLLADPSGQYLICGDSRGRLHLFEKPVGTTGADWFDQEPKTWRGHRRKVCGVTWLGKKHRVATVSEDGTCAIWDLHSQRFVDAINQADVNRIAPETRLQVSSGPVEFVDSSPCGERVVTVGEDRVIRIWDTRNGLETLSLLPRSSRVRSIQISPDERYLLIAQALHFDIVPLKD